MGVESHEERVPGALRARAFARHPHYAVAHARGYDAESHVAAMDIEGINVAVIYGTYKLNGVR